MVFAANGAFSVDGTVYGARFRLPAADRRGRRAPGASTRPTAVAVRRARRRSTRARATSRTCPAAYGGLILAGYGFRTEPAAHAEAQEVLGRPVVSLRLVDPRFYHLDVALAALDDRHVAYYPAAFSPRLPAGAARSSSRTR